jgi:putative hemolysin
MNYTMSARAADHLHRLRMEHPRSEHAANLALADSTAHRNHDAWREIASHLLATAVANVQAIPWSDDVNTNPNHPCSD